MRVLTLYVHVTKSLYDIKYEQNPNQTAVNKVLWLKARHRMTPCDVYAFLSILLFILVALSFENDHQEAVNIRENQVMPIYRERLGDHPFTATILNNLSNNYRDLEEFDAAEDYAEQALVIRRELLADHRDTTKSLFDLGMALKANKKFREAKDFLEKCKAMQEKVVNDSTLEEK